MYCQYILGIGHLMRTLVIAKEVAETQNVVVLCGGQPVKQLERKSNAKIIWLDSSCERDKLQDAPGKPTDCNSRTNSRLRTIKTILKSNKPDVFWVEAFPFARRKFKKEIISSIRYVRKHFPACKIFSSVRDILLQYGGDKKSRETATPLLNRYFDKLFVHSDPKKVSFNTTFGSLDIIECPIVYTGYVVDSPSVSIKKKLWSEGGDIVVNIGGSHVGYDILPYVIECHNREFFERRMHIFLCPTNNGNIAKLQNLVGAKKKISIHPFTNRYINYLKASAISICMGGYNSIIETIATNTPSVVIPLDNNCEQKIRLELLRDENEFEIISLDNVSVLKLSNAIKKVSVKRPIKSCLDMEGAKFIKKYLEG